MQRWRSLLSLKSSSILELSSSNATASSATNSFHSTSVLSEKWRKNFGSNSSIRFTCTVKEKGRRTGAKKTLNNLLFHTGINDPLQNECHFGPNPLVRDRHMKKKPQPGRGKKPRDKKTKRWHREGNLDDDDFGADATNTFENKWRQRWTNQSHKASYSRDSASGFEWREGWSWTTQSSRSTSWNDESCDEPLIVGSLSERNVLGLPLDGPLNLGDVKNAFRSAALKWHPDKHQGPSQAAAQEKFKLCVDAYKSLCSALS
ncbi:hypothetical protein EUTSA_v10022818mg [Eutrema salsugineum]|uniref:J domain-containing protein n=1 Tax=Eutrema salsugineum TaxID=72664 RepID=V4NUZ0_EUTSA|nr:hypothetical protein EUTSA_v10022818mg [Eutrema salsugineum]